MNHQDRQLELFSDGVRAIAARGREKPPELTEAKLEAILQMRTWFPADTLNELQGAGAFRREQARKHYRVLGRLRRSRVTCLTFAPKAAAPLNFASPRKNRDSFTFLRQQTAQATLSKQCGGRSNCESG